MAKFAQFHCIRSSLVGRAEECRKRERQKRCYRTEDGVHHVKVDEIFDDGRDR